MRVLEVPKDQIIRVVDHEGNVLFEEDAVLLRAMFDDLTTTTKSIEQQYKKIKEAIDKKYGCNISPSTLYILGDELDKALVELKKSTSPSPSSSDTTEPQS